MSSDLRHYDRRLRRRTFALLAFLIAVPSLAQDRSTPTDPNNPTEHRASHNSIDGVGGLVIITPDLDWKEKWDTPSSTTPKLVDTHTAALGTRLHILTFITNPTRGQDGVVHVTCDFSMQKPDGTYTAQKQDLDCLTGPIVGDSHKVYLLKLVIGFIGEASDPHGRWTVRVTVKDLVKPVVIPLETTFDFN